MRPEYKWTVPAALLVIFLVSAVESRTCTRVICTTERRWVCAYRTWQGCCYYKWVYKPVVRTETYCCPGFKGRNCNQPICNPPCQNGGTCTSPGVCQCTAGRNGPVCNGTAPCSVRQPCYPGICDGNCRCQDGFTEKTCLQLQNNAPDVYQTRVRLASLKVAPGSSMDGMLMYELNAESSNPSREFVDEIWSNQNGFTKIEVNGVAQFDPTNLYPRPSYVNSSDFGVTSAVAEVKHTKHDSSSGGRRDADTKTHTCREVNNENLASYWNCTAVDDKFDTRIDNADELEVTFTFKSGGYRLLSDGTRDNYTEQRTDRKLKYKFDLHPPTHCVSSNPSCSQKPLLVQEEITRNPVSIRWDGWSDLLSGMYRYAWEIFRLEPVTADGKLGEKLPLQPLINNAWFTSNGTLPVRYTPPRPGMYSVILEASDRANNSRYARRLFLYDNVSVINVDRNNNTRLFVSSAADNTDNHWQADLTNDIVVEWAGHFVNRIHRDNKLLNAVQKYPAQFTDLIGDGRFTQKSINFDDSEGKRTLAAIPNANGIVKFEVAYDKDNQGGTTLNTPSSWKDIGASETYVIRGENRRGGETIRVWVRATDIMGNSELDNTLVSFDDTEPHFNINTLQKNIVGGKYQYSSIIPLRAFDEESGIWSVTWQITLNSTGIVKMTGQLELTPFKMTKSACNSQAKEECYCTLANECYRKKLEIELNHCWFVVPKERLESEVVTMDIKVTNPAMLTTTRILKINDLPSFSGIGLYSPPTNVRVIRGGFNTVRIAWDNTPSCYIISELWLNYTGDPVKREIHKNSSFYDITGLIPETNYSAHLVTGYDGEMSDPVEFVFRTAVDADAHPTPETPDFRSSLTRQPSVELEIDVTAPTITPPREVVLKTPKRTRDPSPGNRQCKSARQDRRKESRERPPSPDKYDRLAKVAKRILDTGCMPLLPPARRDWGDRSFTLCTHPIKVTWPPAGWRDMSPDVKLMNWEFAAMSLQTARDRLLAEDRRELLDRFNMLGLPGTKAPSILDGSDGQTEMRKARLFNYKVLTTIALGRFKGPAAKRFVNMMDSACHQRSRAADYITRSISSVPLRLDV